jgi:hypothetical protein
MVLLVAPGRIASRQCGGRRPLTAPKCAAATPPQDAFLKLDPTAGRAGGLGRHRLGGCHSHGYLPSGRHLRGSDFESQFEDCQGACLTTPMTLLATADEVIE